MKRKYLTIIGIFVAIKKLMKHVIKKIRFKFFSIFWTARTDSYIEDFVTFKRSGLFLYTNLFTIYNNKEM